MMSGNILPGGKLWVCTDHDVHWPPGGGAVIWAASEVEAAGILRNALRLRGLDANQPFTLKPVPLFAPVAIVLNDGTY